MKSVISFYNSDKNSFHQNQANEKNQEELKNLEYLKENSLKAKEIAGKAEVIAGKAEEIAERTSKLMNFLINRNQEEIIKIKITINCK